MISETNKVDLKPVWLLREKLQITGSRMREVALLYSTNIKMDNKEITTLCQLTQKLRWNGQIPGETQLPKITKKIDNLKNPLSVGVIEKKIPGPDGYWWFLSTFLGGKNTSSTQNSKIKVERSFHTHSWSYN